MYHEHHAGCTPYVEATERTVTTTVKRITTLRLKWRGKVRSCSDEEVLSTDVKVWKKREDWEEVK